MGQIKVEKNAGGIEGLCVIEPSVHGDQRGYFMETYNQKDMEEAGLTMKFVQDNQSGSGKAVLRGLHFQKRYPQGKLVRVIREPYLMWRWISGKEVPPMENGMELNCRKRIKSSFTFRKDLRMDFWC